MAKVAASKPTRALHASVSSPGHFKPKANTRLGRQAVTKSRPSTLQASRQKPTMTASAMAKQGSRFLELPPEIRNMIYDALFIVNDIVPNILPQSSGVQKSPADGLILKKGGSAAQLDVFIEGNAKRVRWGLELPYQAGGAIWSDPRVRRRKPSSFSPAIFTVNKQIHAEAASYFYGFNNFRFVSTVSLYSFLCAAGEHARFLRSIEISGYWRQIWYGPSAHKSAKLLSEVGVNLKRFHLEFARGLPWDSIAKPRLMATAFASLFQMLYKRDNDSLQRLWEVVTLGNDGEDKVIDLEAMEAADNKRLKLWKKARDVFRPAVEADLAKEQQELEKGSKRSTRRGLRAIKRVKYAEVVNIEDD